MAEHLRRYWLTLIARGLLAVVLAVTSLRTPGTDLAALMLCFGAYLIADGVLSMLSAFGCGACWGALLLTGATDFFLASLIFVRFDVFDYLFDDVIVVWSLILAVMCFVSANELRGVLHHERLFRAAGAVLVLLSVALLAYPSPRVEVYRSCLGVSLFLYGTLLVALGIQLRGPRPRGGHRLLS